MPSFTIETTYRLPVFRQRTYQATSLNQACRLAIDDDDWSGQRADSRARAKARALVCMSGIRPWMPVQQPSLGRTSRHDS